MSNYAFKTLVPTVALLLTILGCATAPSTDELSRLDYGSAPQDTEAIVKRHFNEILIDPESARYEFETPQKIWMKESPLGGSRLLAGYLILVSVNAKNRMGGYTGKKQYGFLVKDDRIIKILNEFDLENLRRKL